MHRRRVAVSVLLLTAALAFGPALAADAQQRSGNVTVHIPARIVLDGTSVPVDVEGDALHGSDTVAVGFVERGALQTADSVRPNARTRISSTLLPPAAAVVLRVTRISMPCDLFDADPCHVDASGYSELVRGLTVHDSNVAVAKYGARIALRGVRTGGVVTWTATATRWSGLAWVPWSGATLSVAGATQTSDEDGTAVWIVGTDAALTATASAASTSTVWGATSDAVAVPARDAGGASAPHATVPRRSATRF